MRDLLHSYANGFIYGESATKELLTSVFAKITEGI